MARSQGRGWARTGARPGRRARPSLIDEGVQLRLLHPPFRDLPAVHVETPISRALLIVVVVWMAIIFVSLGMFAPDNGTVVTAFGSAALSVAGAIFLILELTRPFSGTVRISSEPLRSAIEQLTR